MPTASGSAASNSGVPGAASTTRARSRSHANGVGSDSSVTSTSGSSAMPPVIANGGRKRDGQTARPARCIGGAAGYPGRMTPVTQLLDAAAAGDRRAAADLLPLVYDELRKLAAARMAAESPGHTLDATALVHEAYLRLVGPADDRRWDNRGHFFAAA